MNISEEHCRRKKNRFEKRMLEDETSADEIAFYLSAKKVVQEKLYEGKKTCSRELYMKTKRQPEIVRSMNKTWLYAPAAIVVAFLAGILHLMQPSSGLQLTDRYIEENLKTLPVTMSSSQDSMQSCLQLYKKNKPAQAAQQFESIIRQDTAN